MSLSPVEVESLAPHVPHMRGHVVIAGLGMGLALYNALRRPAVWRVTVVERDPEVIALFDAIRGAEWPFPNRAAIDGATP
jgi:predicted membrane-bound spermidine synthase